MARKEREDRTPRTGVPSPAVRPARQGTDVEVGTVETPAAPARGPAGRQARNRGADDRRKS